MGCSVGTLSEEELELRRVAEAFRVKVIREVAANRHKSVCRNQTSPGRGASSSAEFYGHMLSDDGHSGVGPCLSGRACSSCAWDEAEVTPMKPLRTMSHVERGSLLMGDNFLEQRDDIAVNIPGRVGCDDDRVVISTASNAHMLLRTRRVHKHKHSVRRHIANRRLTNLERDIFPASLLPLAAGGEGVLDEDERRDVLKVLQRHFLTAPLLRDEHEMLTSQVARLELAKGNSICQQGEKGDCCYIMLSGTCAVAVNGERAGDGPQLSAGHVFGEIAMLYDVPRTATIVCTSPRVVVGKIQGVSFRRCLARFKERTLNQTLGFLNGHELFSKLSIEDKRIFANALHPQFFEVGAMVFDETLSRSADWMFLVQEGSVEVTDQYRNRKVLTEGAVFSGQRMHYGQKAMSAKALSKLRVLTIGAPVLNRLFGNITEILRRATVRHHLFNQVKVFRELTDKQQMTMSALFEQQHFKRGEVIVTSMADPQLAVVLDGEVSVLDSNAMSSMHSTHTSEQAVGRDDGLAKPGDDAHATREPELEPEEAIFGSWRARQSGREQTLFAGDVYGEATFREGCCMARTMVAKTDTTVCRAGHDEVCRALRGHAEKTPPLSWIVLRNKLKDYLQKTFPFSALYEEMLDVVVEAFESAEYPANGTIVPTGDGSRRFFVVIQGEALMRTPGAPMEPLARWRSFGVEQLLLGRPVEFNVVAAGGGCTLKAIGFGKFREVCGVLYYELATKMRHKDLRIKPSDCIVLGKLGQGQFGAVRKVCVRGILGETFALKRISKRKVLETDQQQAVKLEREILDECCHPLIVRLLTTYQDEHSVYILMENVAGGDLFTAIRHIGALSEEQTLFFGASIVLAVEYLHARGVMYRDLKPENVMLQSSGFVKLVDMGCCSRKLRSYTFVGTPEYLAPEVVTGQGYTQAVDWWSVGVILYEMICGPLPFGEGCIDPLAVMREVLEKPLEVPARVPADAADLLASLLERTPEQRLGSSTSRAACEVKEHQFFEHLCWDAILEHSTVPPYVPPKKKGRKASGRHALERADTAPLQHRQTLPAKSTDAAAATRAVRNGRGTIATKLRFSTALHSVTSLHSVKMPRFTVTRMVHEEAPPIMSERVAHDIAGDEEDHLCDEDEDGDEDENEDEDEEEEEMPTPPDGTVDLSCFEGF